MPKLSTAAKQLIGDYIATIGIAGSFSVVFLLFMPLPPGVTKLSMATYSTLVFGNAFFLLGTVRPRIRLRTFILNLLAQTLLTFLTILAGFVAVVYIFSDARQSGASQGEIFISVLKFALGPMMLGYGVMALILSGLINVAFQIDKKMGPGILWNWVTGKYYSPKEEERIFMFLDMKDSTSIAERLGNIKFSALVRDFFRDLTLPVIETKAEVSHYIGDEAVLTWKPKSGLKNQNCLAIFERFRETLDGRSAYYLREYGFVPEFKAGVHIGNVVATEVGEIKSEIVFHGDVLNTAARIQSLCGELGSSLLVSEALKVRLEGLGPWALDARGAHELKGKAEPMQLFSARPAAK